MIEWLNINDIKPEDGQSCLTKMKHGIIEGIYDLEEDEFHGYYFGDIFWRANSWIPIERIE